MDAGSEYVSIPFAKNYFINKSGTVIHIYKNGKIRELKPYTEPNGYLRVCMTDNNKKSKKFYVHRLLGLMFIQNPDKNPLIDHKDHNRSNNNLSNLSWVTYRGNSRNRKISKNNTTGYRGIIYKKNGEYEYYIANWTDCDGRKRVKSFNCKKYGKEEALNLALKKRKEIEELYYNYC